ncbi:MAG: xanthine dehydrogenase family protein molybdopterin-binding subunit, partial [Streptosporangiaceae bacterium]
MQAQHAAGHVGTPRRRNEDRRHLRGQGRFVADLKLHGMREIAFVRSQHAHGRIRGVSPPEGLRSEEFWTHADLEGLAASIVADAAHLDFRSSEYVLLAKDKVRFVGEPVAMVIGDDRAAAEDLAEQVVVDIDALPAVVDAHRALDPGAALLHEHWADNRFLTATGSFGDVDAAAARAAASVSRTYRMGRQAGVPLETRGCVAYYDSRVDQLVLYSSTQFPHVIRTILAQTLGLEERRVRVVAPDVGGGFGIKNNLYPEEVLTAVAALRTGYPVRWIEDRYEHLVASAHAREHEYTITAYADAGGTLLAVEAEILVDAGAYSVWPWTAAQEGSMASGIIPGPYRIGDYRFTATTVATNKAPMGPYRGVARPGACFAIERTIDELAGELGMEAKDLRMRNMIRPEELPYTSVTGKVYDSGDYADSVRGAAREIGHDAVRARQRPDAEPGGKRIGVGYASYTEQTAHGTTEWASRGLPVVFGFESANVAIDPSGGVTVRTGIQSHGQGLETTLAQVAADVLGVDPAAVTVLHGDSSISPYGMGTFASRSMVMAGGATHRAAEELAGKVRRIAAHLLSCREDEVSLDRGKVHGPLASVTLGEVADAAYLHVERLPEGVVPSLEVTDYYQPEVDTGAFSYSTHAVVAEVDTDSGDVRLLDYVVVEDCGRVVNPLIVDGQVHGGVAQGIGTALYEEITYDEDGQPKATTFLDYLLPGATEIPAMRVEHRETLSPFTELGIKGMGEG